MGNEGSRKFEIKDCIISGCTEDIEPRHFMCSGHFMSLGRDQQQQFYRARFKYEQNAEGSDQMMTAVMQTCADVVQAKIEETAGNIDGVSAG